MLHLNELIFIDNLPSIDLHGENSDTARVMINDFIKIDWKFDSNTKMNSTRQLRFLLWHSIVSNILLAILNSYPLVVPYQENCWVILMLIFLWLFNISSICNAIYTLKHLNTLVEENINRFN